MGGEGNTGAAEAWLASRAGDCELVMERNVVDRVCSWVLRTASGAASPQLDGAQPERAGLSGVRTLIRGASQARSWLLRAGTSECVGVSVLSVGSAGRAWAAEQACLFWLVVFG